MDSDLDRDSEAIEERAARWFARHESGSWTEADQVELQAWLGERTAHRIAYVRLEAAWHQSARMQALGDKVSPAVIPARGSWGYIRFARAAASSFTRRTRALYREAAGEDSASFASSSSETAQAERELAAVAPGARRLRRSRRFVAIAACLFALSVGGYHYHAKIFSGDRYTTPVGGIDHVRLDDGSRVTLNTDTRIRVTFSKGERRIQLDRGEAYFEVAKDRTRPFVVYAGERQVMAVGTKFAVRRDAEDLLVVVTEGRVHLSATPSYLSAIEERIESSRRRAGHASGGSESAGGVASFRGPPATDLRAGDIARTSRAEVLVRNDAASEAEKLLSWRVGYVIFDDTPLADVVAEFNRYNSRKIYIDDPDIAAIRIGGNFRSTNTDAFLWLLQSGFPIAVEEQGDRVVLRAR